MRARIFRGRLSHHRPIRKARISPWSAKRNWGRYEVCSLIIVVSTRYIKCLSVRELREGQEITENSYNYLSDRVEFDLRKDVVIDFCDFARTFFENVPQMKYVS